VTRVYPINKVGLDAKIFENFPKSSKIRCILQGFADRGGVAQEIGWFIKNIQPISVGV
jgi:hypothetical protein